MGNTYFSTSFDSTVTSSAPASDNTDNGQGDSGGVTIIESSGNDVGNVDITSTSNGGAMGKIPHPTMMPRVAGGVLAAAAVNLAVFL